MVTEKQSGRLRLLAGGNRDLADTVLSRQEGGRKLDDGLKARLNDRFGFTVEVVFAGCPDVSELLFALRNQVVPNPAVVDLLANETPEVLLLSLGPELDGAPWEIKRGSLKATAFFEDLVELIRLLKHKFRCHVLIMNASTVDPESHVSNYSRVTDEPVSLTANRLNSALIRASIEEGISVIDVDRLIAELGAGEHVLGFLDYSKEACDAICNELIRVVEDYGFFDDRPLLVQLGRERNR